ncbi:hypothetical protein D4R86_01470 [bacterium]|nr:MAG: hypothetical protein D4R86_01470 [bacterium]
MKTKCNLKIYICDFCVHYVDDYAYIENSFAGEGICGIDNERVQCYWDCHNKKYKCKICDTEILPNEEK